MIYYLRFVLLLCFLGCKTEYKNMEIENGQSYNLKELYSLPPFMGHVLKYENLGYSQKKSGVVGQENKTYLQTVYNATNFQGPKLIVYLQTLENKQCTVVFPSSSLDSIIELNKLMKKSVCEFPLDLYRLRSTKMVD